jgi:hypothetical protein
VAERKRRVGLARALREELRRVEALIEAWSGTAQPDKEATDRLLALQKQRLALLQASAQMSTDEHTKRPVEIVFVDDWRETVE